MTILLYGVGGLAVLVAAALFVVFRSGHVVVDDPARQFDEWRARLETEFADENSTNHDGPWKFVLPLSGSEVFTPFKLLTDRVYRITITGRYWDRSRDTSVCADGFYLADAAGNLTRPSCRLSVDAKRLDDLPGHRFTEERARNRYSFLVDGTSNYLSLSFAASVGAFYSHLHPLTATVTIEPPGTPLLSVVQAAERVREEGELRTRKLETLVVMAEALRNWEDPAFRTQYATRFTKDLLSAREKITGDFFALYEDPVLLERLQAEHPTTWSRIVGRFEALIEAERINATGPKRGPRLTPEQFRARLVNRAAIAAGDQQALMEAAIEAYNDKRTLLLETGVDEDTVEAVIGPISDAVDATLAHQSTGKGGGDAITVG